MGLQKASGSFRSLSQRSQVHPSVCKELRLQPVPDAAGARETDAVRRVSAAHSQLPKRARLASKEEERAKLVM